MILISSIRSVSLAAALSGSFAIAAILPAQSPVTQPPQITVNARGEVQVAPDRARIQVGVETQARTSVAAANENNRKQAAVLSAIRALGIPASSITTLNYTVYPVQRYDDKEKRTVIDGYRVSNVVQVETDKLDQAGAIIDAGLTNGANRVAGLDFYVKDAAAAKDQALAKAIESAKRQAQAAATAAGGSATELLEININDFEQPVPRVMAMARAEKADAAYAPAPLSEGTTTVSVMVSTRWKFTPAK